MSKTISRLNAENKVLKDIIYQLRDIITRIPCPFFWQNIHGVYQGCNEEYINLIGLQSTNQIIDKSNDALKNTNCYYFLKDLDKFNHGVITTKKSLSFEKQAKFKNECYRTFTVKKEPLFDKNKNVSGILTIFTNQVASNKNQNDHNLDNTKNAHNNQYSSISLSNIAHEIRGPLANISAFLSVLNQQIIKIKTFFYTEIFDMLLSNNIAELLTTFNDLNNQMIDNCKVCSDESFKALNYLDNYVELHRLQTQSTECRFENTDISQLVDRSIKNSAHLNKSRIAIDVKFDKDMPKHVFIDYRNIYEALHIIICNAIRFNHPNGMVLIKSSLAEFENQTVIKIIIQDFGIGISETTLKNLFLNNTYLGTDDSIHKYNKPSLKLPQAKLKIEASGGQLSIESQLGIGTKVTLLIPYKKVVSNEEDKIHSNEKPHFLPLNILLIEDDPITQIAQKATIEALGHNVDITNTGMQAIVSISAKPYDLVLLDISLPDMTGIDILRILRKHVSLNISVIAITAHASEEDIDLFMSEGAIAVLAKPVDQVQLKACIDNFLEGDANDHN